MKKRRSIKFFVKLICVICVSPCGISVVWVGFLLCNISSLSTEATIGEIGDITFSLVGVITSVLLSYLVSVQSEMSYTLEASQYDIFLGVEKIDSSIIPPTEMMTLYKDNSSPISLFEDANSNGLAWYVHVQLSNRAQLTMLPLVFITKNTPLITSLHFESVNFAITCSDESQECDVPCNKKFSMKGVDIYKFLPDQSRFILCLGIHGISADEIRTLTAQIELSVNDQWGRNIRERIEVSVVKIDGTLYLADSRSECVDTTGKI